MTSAYCCYILTNERGNTYVGSTNNLTRRLRQHNGIISGGARSTRGKGPWRVLCTVACVDETQQLDHSLNLSMEWHLRNPDKKHRHEYYGVDGRLKSVDKLLLNSKFNHVQFKVSFF